MIDKLLTSLLLLIALFALPASAQRKVTPVPATGENKSKPKLYYYDRHGNPLKEPVEFLIDTDTAARPGAKPVYPLLYSADVGINFFDALMLAAGQKHASFDLHAELSLYNWIFPVIEAGIGFADSRPENGNFHYVGKPSFYTKIGLNYNFLYKSNPDYQVFLGLRGGFSSFTYEIRDISVNAPYWNQSSDFSILNQNASAFFGEILAGVKVRIYRNFSLGWSVRFHFKFHTSSPLNSNPWFIPGFGTNSPLTATFSAIYHIPFKTKNSAPILEAEDK